MLADEIGNYLNWDSLAARSSREVPSWGVYYARLRTILLEVEYLGDFWPRYAANSSSYLYPMACPTARIRGCQEINMRILVTILTLITLASFVQGSGAHPKATDRAQRWQLRLDTGDLRFYRDSDSGEGYWILIYEVTNETKSDRQWIPSFELVTDRGEIISDSDNVPRGVQLAVLAIFDDPLMLSQSDASGPILQGEENAIKSIVIWKAGREDVREVQIFAGGVSGDTADVVHPITGEEHTLRRVLQLSWFVNGSVDQIALTPLPKRAVTGGTSTLRLSTDEEDGIGGNDVQRKWIFR